MSLQVSIDADLKSIKLDIKFSLLTDFQIFDGTFKGLMNMK